MISVPVKNRKDPRGYTMQNQEIIDPHNLRLHLFTRAGAHIANSDVQEFWNHVRKTAPQEAYISNGATTSHIPVAIYGDAAKLSNAACNLHILAFAASTVGALCPLVYLCL